MKKFLGVLVAITFCVCMLVPAASALDASSLTDYLAGVDFSTLSETDLTAILGDLGLEDFDAAAIINGDESAIKDLEASLGSLTGETTTAAAASNTSGVDTDWLTGVLGGQMDTSAATDMLGDLGAGDLDSLLGTVEGAFSGAGVDLNDYELGADVAGSSTSESAVATDTVTTIADSLFSGLEALGFDTSLIEGMLDNQCASGGKNVAAIVLEPIQGWGGTIIPPADFIPALRALCDKRGILLFADEVLNCMARTGKYLAMDHWDVTADLTTLGKGFGNGFPVTALAVSKELAPAIEKISASSSYGGNPMACIAALESIRVIEEEGLNEHSAHLGEIMLARMEQMKEAHPIIGDVRAIGCRQAIEVVKDRETKEPFAEAGQMIYQKAFEKGLAWVPSGHILRMSPPMILDDAAALKGLDIIEEAIAETEKHFGY